jgi:hypothetical protein
MEVYKRNQVEEAIFRTLGARDARADEVRFRLKRLLVADRQASLDEDGPRYAFFDQEPPGSGVEIMFSSYEAFALLAAIILLEHGLPQATVVKVMRQVRHDLDVQHARVLKIDPDKLFDPQAIRAQAQPGMMAVDNTDPVFLAIARLTGSSVDSTAHPPAAVCRGQAALIAFMKKRSQVGLGATFFEFAGLMHTMAKNLSRTRPTKRGRGVA